MHFSNFSKYLVLLLISLQCISCATNKNPPHYPTAKEIKQKLNHRVTKNDYKLKNFRRTKDGSYEYAKDSRYTFRLGLDVSHHDGEIDWKLVKESGRDFAFIRAGYRGYQTGELKLDNQFHANMKGAREAGLDTGVYFFSQAITEEEAVEEARFVLNELQEYQLQLPVVYDPEGIPWDEARTDGLEREQIMKNTHAFCNEIKAAGYEPMIYSNLRWELDYFDLEELEEYKIWYADYRKRINTPYHFEFLQYGGESETIPGVGRKCDGDIQIIATPQ